MLDRDYTKRPSASQILDTVRDWPRAEGGFGQAEEIFVNLATDIEQRTGYHDAS
jgi:hypothetical protein